MLPSYFVIIGTLIGTIGSLAYLIDTIKGEVKPNRVSFLLWSIAPLIAFAAQMQQQAGLEALMTFSTGIIPLIIFLASFVNKDATWQLTKFDLTCGALSIIGLIVWQITKVGNLAITISIIADALAAVPTIIKAYRYPETEIAWPWIMTSIGVVLTILTLNQITFTNSAFITYVFIANTLIFSLVQFRIKAFFQK